MALYCFLSYVVEVDYLWLLSGLLSGQLRRSAQRHQVRYLESHHQDPQWLARIIGKAMLHARSQVCEIIRAQGKRAVTVVQNACALQNKVNFFVAIVENALAAPMGIQCSFAKAGNASQNSNVSRSEERRVGKEC